MTKKLELRYPTTTHTISIEQNGGEHKFEVSVSWAIDTVANDFDRKFPVNIIFNRVGGDQSGLNLIIDKIGHELSKILMEEYC